ncbi:hypothetical protein U1Q18_035679 [Sarracenia purpurea var. burkii]
MVSSLSIDKFVADDIGGDWKKGDVNFTVTVDETVRVSSEMSEGEEKGLSVAVAGDHHHCCRRRLLP